jgi:DNA repair exonuclease SbcCD ATPase subunit
MTENPEKLDDSALQAEVDALRNRVTDTRALYREVCGLLFFKYGSVPTANRLYQLVRKGSMGVPGEVLTQFWVDLREKSRVKIDHPDMPDAIKQVAVEAMQGIWEAAAAAARSELSDVRADVELRAQEAEVQRQQTQTALDYARREIAVGQEKLDELARELTESQELLQAERAAHAATEARLQEMRRQVEERDRQLTETRAQFSTELEHARQQVTDAAARAAATERRVMLEFDSERTLRQKGEKLIEELRAELGSARNETREADVRHADAVARLQSELQGVNQRLTVADAAQDRHAGLLSQLRAELDEATRRAERAETEVEVTRRLIAGFKSTPVEKAARRRST